MKLKVGDIFTIPIDEERTGFGQVIFVPDKNSFMMVVFKSTYRGEEWPSLNEIINNEIFLLGYSLDAKLYHKHWRIIGNNSSNISSIVFPFFKLGTPPDCRLVDYKGAFVKKINKQLFDKLEFQSVTAPVGYELALKAFYGIGEWNSEYDELLYKNIVNAVAQVK